MQVMTALVMSLGAAFNAHAALNCTIQNPWLDMLSGNFGGFFAFPDDVDTLPIGARVGGLREVNLRFNCTGMLAAEQFGTEMLAVAGLHWHAPTQTWTSPQLEALGLGFRIWWHEPNNHIDHNPDPHPNSNPTVDYFPVNWYPRPKAAPHLKISTRVIFFKINNNFQNTNGSQTPVSINADLFKFRIHAKNTTTGAITPRSPIQTYTLNFTQFSSRQRVCTPLVNQMIDLGTMTAAEMASVGVVESSTKTFSLNFICPHMAYYMVGFRLEGVYGVLDNDNGVFGIKQGPGYASGVGVQFSGQNLAISWRDNPSYNPETWQILKPSQDYFIPWFEYSSDFVNTTNPTTATRNRLVNFRAKYYRMPGVLQGGTVESRVLVRFVYQ